MDNGEYLGFNKKWYAASKPSRDHQMGKFKLCKTNACLDSESSRSTPVIPFAF